MEDMSSENMPLGVVVVSPPSPGAPQPGVRICP